MTLAGSLTAVQVPRSLTMFQVPQTVTTVTALLTAVVGGFVAYQAYRGYRRNASRAMLSLAVGILLLTTVPFVLKQPLVLFSLATPAEAQLAALSCRVAGLLAVLYAFTGA